MDNELLNEEMTEQTIEENPIGDDAAAEAGGEEPGSEAPAAPADGEGQEPCGSVLLCLLLYRNIQLRRGFCCCVSCLFWFVLCLEFGIIKGGYDEQYFSNFM